MDNCKYTAYVIYKGHQTVIHTLDSLKQLENWLLTTLDAFSGTLGIIIDNQNGKIVVKHKRLM